jgi:hypothetical protein
MERTLHLQRMGRSEGAIGTSSRSDSFYPRWILANALAEGLGLGATLLLVQIFISPLESWRPGPAAIVFSALLAVMLGIVLEGVLVGRLQGRVLAARTPRIGTGEWTVATALGAGLAWILGMLPSTLIGLFGAEPAVGSTPALPSSMPLWMLLAIAAAAGGVLGPVLAVAQCGVLRRVVRHPWRWVAANAAAWAVGMAVIFAGMDRVPWGDGLLGVAAGIFLTCALAGAAVGAIHGWVLQRMLCNEDFR